MDYDKNYINFMSMKTESKNDVIDVFLEKDIIKTDKFFNITKDGKSHNPIIDRDWLYVTQDLLAFKMISAIRASNPDYFLKSSQIGKDVLLDVGSRFESACYFGSLFSGGLIYNELTVNCTFPCLKMHVLKSEAQNIKLQDNSVPMITSLHAIEHFGLGRYGDEIDYFGDIKGLKEMHRILLDNGFIITSVPCTFENSNIEFHNQRVYNPKDFDDIMSSVGFEKITSTKTLNLFNAVGILELKEKKIKRKSMNLFVLTAYMGTFSWDYNELKSAQKSAKTAAYLSAWRKKWKK